MRTYGWAIKTVGLFLKKKSEVVTTLCCGPSCPFFSSFYLLSVRRFVFLSVYCVRVPSLSFSPFCLCVQDHKSALRCEILPGAETVNFSQVYEFC